jgi:hypothetical protein
MIIITNSFFILLIVNDFSVQKLFAIDKLDYLKVGKKTKSGIMYQVWGKRCGQENKKATGNR